MDEKVPPKIIRDPTISLPSASIPPAVSLAEAPRILGRLSKIRILAAFGVAILSDALSFWLEFLPPLQWILDMTTALLLFAILGWRWLILPALVAEAIPGVALFPVWVLVVASITVWGRLRPGPPAEPTGSLAP
jgi:hypothetical protein